MKYSIMPNFNNDIKMDATDPKRHTTIYYNNKNNRVTFYSRGTTNITLDHLTGGFYSDLGTDNLHPKKINKLIHTFLKLEPKIDFFKKSNITVKRSNIEYNLKENALGLRHAYSLAELFYIQMGLKNGFESDACRLARAKFKALKEQIDSLPDIHDPENSRGYSMVVEFDPNADTVTNMNTLLGGMLTMLKTHNKSISETTDITNALSLSMVNGTEASADENDNQDNTKKTTKYLSSTRILTLMRSAAKVKQSTDNIQKDLRSSPVLRDDLVANAVTGLSSQLQGIKNHAPSKLEASRAIANLSVVTKIKNQELKFWQLMQKYRNNKAITAVNELRNIQHDKRNAKNGKDIIKWSKTIDKYIKHCEDVWNKYPNLASNTALSDARTHLSDIKNNLGNYMYSYQENPKENVNKINIAIDTLIDAVTAAECEANGIIAPTINLKL